jgi:glycosyltransferase involved in cell wall biosynthesis
MDRKKVCAIIPAYKEEKRIESVIIEIEKAKLVDEIIVVDDGSKDNIEDVCKKHKRVKLIKNKKNRGKAFAMDTGVKKTKAEIIIFLDADLINLTYELIDKIILPVKKGDYEMFIATRKKINNKFTLWSGQRAIKRELWFRIPLFYKKGFRIELGMNFFAKSFGFIYKKFNQHIKEEKYGLLWGIYRRFFMILQIIMAYGRYILVDKSYLF